MKLSEFLKILVSTIAVADAFIGHPSGSAMRETSRQRLPDKTMPTPFVERSTSSKDSLVSLRADILTEENSDLLIGMGMIAAACTPYVLGIFFEQLSDTFFLPVYKNATQLEEENLPESLAREAEIQWKLMYATLGLSLTSLTFFEVFAFDGRGAAEVLRDSYVFWAFFYTAAIFKIRGEATEPDIVIKGDLMSRIFIQGWHLLVVLTMWYSVGISPGNWLKDFVGDIISILG